MIRDCDGIMQRYLGKRFLRGAMLALGLAAPTVALAVESAPVTSPRVTATLLSSRDSVAPGERFKLALVQKLAPHWHTYWLNPGDSGEPTQIKWDLPPGATASRLDSKVAVTRGEVTAADSAASAKPGAASSNASTAPRRKRLPK